MSANSSFFMRFYPQHKSTIVQLSIRTNQAILGLVFPIFLAFQCLPKKSASFENFPLVPSLLFAKNRHFRDFYRNCYFSSNSSFYMRFFAYDKSTIVQLSIHTNQAIIGLVFPIFLAFKTLPKKSAIFQKLPFVPSLLFCEKSPFSKLLQKLLFLF